MKMVDQCYLGFEISTQQAKLIVVNEQLKVIHEHSLKFDTDLPEFKTIGGSHEHGGDRVTAPTLMWVKAVDRILDSLKDGGFDFSRIVAMSGTAQQHGSVFWKRGAQTVLTNLEPTECLHEQLKDCFSVPDSPIWMDSSTSKQCQQLEDRVGGAQKLSNITGSRAFARFTGNQIAKLAETNCKAYDETEKIALVSSFAASLFLGDYCPIDFSDGSGMNLLDIQTRQWSEECLEACAPNLSSKLGSAVPSREIIGSVSPFMVQRYGFSPACKVIAFTGDNPASLAGFQLQQDDIILSLGSSDNLIMWLNESTPGLNGHILINPIDETQFMGLLCFKNGSLTRERIQKKDAEGSWEIFDRVLQSSSTGNNGNVGFYFDHREIQPDVMGTYRYNEKDELVSSFTSVVEIRAVIEGQLMAKRIYAEKLGLKVDQVKRILATGGASTNSAILQVVADIFNTPVYIQDIANSACLGSAYRAKHGLVAGSSFSDAMSGMKKELQLSAKPHPDAQKVYAPLCARYKELEERLVQSQST